MNSIYLKGSVQKASWKISPSLSCAISYFHNRHRWPNFKHPKDLSEIVFSQIISGECKQFADYVDKIKVRKFIEEWGLSNYLPQLYGVWNEGKEIDFDKLPNKFALKSNNYVGGHLFCYDKKTFDINFARAHMDDEMKRTTHEIRESQYINIEPKIYAEELLEEDGISLPIDYKIHCCDGQVRGCLVVVDRGKKSGIHLAFYDLDWHKQEQFLHGNEKFKGEVRRPTNYDEMLSIAEMIAKKFTQVRVDFYNIKNKVYIGELTFTPEGGMMSYYTNEAVDYLGHH